MTVDFGQIRRNEHLPARISSQIARDISEGRILPGEKLPTERVLAKGLGGSRSVLREAIVQLRNEGLVKTRQGIGAFVTEPRARPSIRIKQDDLHDRESFRDLFQLRLPLEIEAAGLAAVHHDAGDLDKLDETLAAMTGAPRRPTSGS